MFGIHTKFMQLADMLHPDLVATKNSRRWGLFAVLALKSISPPAWSNFFWLGLISLVCAPFVAEVPVTAPWLLGYAAAVLFGLWAISRDLDAELQRSRALFKQRKQWLGALPAILPGDVVMLESQLPDELGTVCVKVRSFDGLYIHTAEPVMFHGRTSTRFRVADNAFFRILSVNNQAA